VRDNSGNRIDATFLSFAAKLVDANKTALIATKLASHCSSDVEDRGESENPAQTTQENVFVRHARIIHEWAEDVFGYVQGPACLAHVKRAVLHAPEAKGLSITL
jgi:hypothetical protein